MTEDDTVTPHFLFYELTRTSVRGLNNAPPERETAALVALCENVLEPTRVHFGSPLVVHSAYRSPNVNAAIGGSKKSQHVRGEAADFHVVGVKNTDVARWIVDTIDFDQLILEFVGASGYSGWVHCSYVTWRPNRREILRATKGPLGTAYTKLDATAQF